MNMTLKSIAKSLAMSGMLIVPTLGYSADINMMHYWASISEYGALSELRTSALEIGHNVNGDFQTGAGGESTRDKLTSLTISGEAPDAAFVKGTGISRWARLGFLEKISDISDIQNNATPFHPVVAKHMTIHNDLYAIPVSLHRTNLLFANTRVLKKHGIPNPTNWNEMMAALERLSNAGVTPLVIGNESWQLATLYESIVLSIGGPEIYYQAFVEHNLSSFRHPAFKQAYVQLLQLMQYMKINVSNQRWYKASKDFYNNDVGFLIGGDWFNGELSSVGYRVGEHYNCLPFPGTESAFIYSIDSIVMFKVEDKAKRDAQTDIVNMLIDSKFQKNMNLVKGSIPPRNDIVLDDFNDCAKKSAADLAIASGANSLLPSLANGMSTSPFVTKAYLDVMNDILKGEKRSPEAFQKHLRSELKRAQYTLR